MQKRVLPENDMRGYTTGTTGSSAGGATDRNGGYALVPVWWITYKGKKRKIYYYTIHNGQNDKGVWRELPVDYKKLSLISALITGVVFLFGTGRRIVV